MTATVDQPLTLETKADLEDVVSSHERVLVEFYTDGCGICQSMEPVLDGVARASDVVVGTMNPREDPQLIDDYDVQSVPMLLLFVDGELTDTRADGFLGVDEVLEFVEEDGSS
jgi:thioredoxin 1